MRRAVVLLTPCVCVTLTRSHNAMADAWNIVLIASGPAAGCTCSCDELHCRIERQVQHSIPGLLLMPPLLPWCALAAVERTKLLIGSVAEERWVGGAQLTSCPVTSCVRGAWSSARVPSDERLVLVRPASEPNVLYVLMHASGHQFFFM